MKPTDRTIVFLAHALEMGMREVLTLNRELTEAMRIYSELTAKAKVYERENQRLRSAALLTIATGTSTNIRRKLRAVFDAAMGDK